MNTALSIAELSSSPFHNARAKVIVAEIPAALVPITIPLIASKAKDSIVPALAKLVACFNVIFPFLTKSFALLGLLQFGTLPSSIFLAIILTASSY